MLTKLACILGMIVGAVLLVVTVPTTIQLGKMDVGLRSSLHSTSQLVSIESAVIDKNKSLKGLITTAHQMRQQLTTTENTTTQIKQNITLINQLNSVTLKLNQNIGDQAKNSAGNLGDIENSLSALDQATSRLEQTLQSLSGIVSQDKSNLAQMQAATQSMNAKVPGVLG